MNPTSSFFKRSLEVAAGFLQTAVVIDDRAFRDEFSFPEATPGPLVEPDSLATADLSLPTPVIAQTDISVSDQANPNPHGIDARAVIASFAQLGIICSVLRREPNEDLTMLGDRAHKLSVAADISVVDWEVHHVDGSRSHDETLKFLRSAVEESLHSQPEQLRLIIIYTGSLDLVAIADEVGQFLQSSSGVAPDKEGDFAFRIRAIRIVVLGKPSNKRSVELRTQQVESEDELANRAVEEFATMTAGLVSNVVLASLSEIRRATHRLLTRFGIELDAPFLAHRALLDPPTEGNEQLLPLIVAELEAILEEQLSDDLLSDDAITDWLSTRPDPLPLIDSASAPHIKTTETARQAVRDLSLKGVVRYEDFAVTNEPSWVKHLAAGNKGVPYLAKLTNLIAGESVDGSNEELELLMSLRPRYNDAPPMLTLGTLLASSQLGECSSDLAYWLCLQPACDSYVRGGRPRRYFPLLELKATTTNFNLIVKDHAGVIHLRWEPKPYEMRMIEFETNSVSGSVLAVAEEKEFWFVPHVRSFRFRWLGELKFPQAQRVAQALANEEGRIGLTESEWLRRYAK